MGNENGMPPENRTHILISLISLIAGVILTWFGYRYLKISGLPDSFGLNGEISEYWPLLSGILGVALMISGVLGMLRGRVL